MGLLFFLSFSKEVLASPEEEEIRIISNKGGANVRLGPGLNYSKAFFYPRNKLVRGRKEGAWFRIEKESGNYYLAYSLTTRATRRYLLAGAINIREKPSLKSRIIARASYGQEVIGYRQGAWFKFNLNGKEAYVAHSWTGARDPRTQTLDFLLSKKSCFSSQTYLDYIYFDRATYLQPAEPGRASLKVLPKTSLIIEKDEKDKSSWGLYQENRYYLPAADYEERRLYLYPNYLDQVDYSYKRFIRGISVVDSLAKGVVAEYNSSLSLIKILDSYKTNQMVIYHELGHAISYKARADGKRLHEDNLWKNIWQREWSHDKSYGASNEIEGFAESFVAYVFGYTNHYRGNLKRDKPLSYQYMKELNEILIR